MEKGSRMSSFQDPGPSRNVLGWWGRCLMTKARGGTHCSHSQDTENFFLNLGDAFRSCQKYSGHN